jgi:hypothetical protein
MKQWEAVALLLITNRYLKSLAIKRKSQIKPRLSLAQSSLQSLNFLANSQGTTLISKEKIKPKTLALENMYQVARRYIRT